MHAFPIHRDRYLAGGRNSSLFFSPQGASLPTQSIGRGGSPRTGVQHKALADLYSAVRDLQPAHAGPLSGHLGSGGSLKAGSTISTSRPVSVCQKRAFAELYVCNLYAARAAEPSIKPREDAFRLSP